MSFLDTFKEVRLFIGVNLYITSKETKETIEIIQIIIIGILVPGFQDVLVGSESSKAGRNPSFGLSSTDSSVRFNPAC